MQWASLLQASQNLGVQCLSAGGPWDSISNLSVPVQSLSGGHQIILCCSLWTSNPERVTKLLKLFFVSPGYHSGKD